MIHLLAISDSKKPPPKGRKVPPPKPWSPAKATTELRTLASRDFNLCMTDHSKDQMLERELFTGDMKHILKYGFVYEKAKPATRQGFFKYKMESTTPNSGNRSVRIVVIPSVVSMDLKIVTVMRVDE